MQIGFDAKRLFLNNRGLGSYARTLLYSLQKYAADNSYHLLTPDVKNEYVSPSLINSNNVNVQLPSGIGKLNSSLWRSGMLGKQANKLQLDVFHGLSQELPLDIKRFNGKSVVTIHDMIFLKYPEFYRPIDRWIYYRKVKFAVENADVIIAISKQTRNDLVSEFSIPENKIHIIYQSCAEVFADLRTEREIEILKEKWGLPDDYILYVGALNPNKNIAVILEALDHLKGQDVPPLVIVGRGSEYRHTLEQFIDEKNLGDQVIFASDIGNPSPLELSTFYQLASLFVFPSFYEGFGIPIIESRFSGTPVIASNSSCLDEAGGSDTVYFNPDDSKQLSGLIIEALKRGKFEQNQQELSKFNQSFSANAIMELYR